MALQKFWMVMSDFANEYGDQQVSKLPRYRHSNQNDAVRECERLAREYAGTRFFLLEVIGVVEFNAIRWEKSELEGMPF